MMSTRAAEDLSARWRPREPFRRSGYRVLVYSHDSRGLGQIRRCSVIADALAERHPDLNVLVLGDSPIGGRSSPGSRVDFVRVPGLVRPDDGGYTARKLGLELDHVLALRRSIIEHTARIFAPDLVLVDKYPLGLLGEVPRALHRVRRRGGCRLVVGLPDVPDWRGEAARRAALRALDQLYDHIWVYGLADVFDPRSAYAFPRSVAEKTEFTGYVGRTAPSEAPLPDAVADAMGARPFLLVTTGGGGHGAQVVDAALAAYERCGDRLPWPAVIVFGPFLPAGRRTEFERRAARLARVATLAFHEPLESLMIGAAAVVSSGGYNTFCEALSLGKRVLVVPDGTASLDRLVRARAAERRGLAQVLRPDRLDPATLAEALARLSRCPAPATARIAEVLGGLPQILATVARWRVTGGRRASCAVNGPVSGRRRSAHIAAGRKPGRALRP